MVAKMAARPRDLVNIILIESEVVETGIDMIESVKNATRFNLS
jgi:hypothetical protein